MHSVDISLRYSLFLFFYRSLILTQSQFLALYCSLSLCLLVNISLIVSLYFHCRASLSHSLSKPYQRRAGRVHHRNEKAVSWHTGVVILARSASIVICGLLSNVSLDQRWTSATAPLIFGHTHTDNHVLYTHWHQPVCVSSNTHMNAQKTSAASPCFSCITCYSQLTLALGKQV